MRIFIDSNVWLRFFLNDLEDQHRDCVELLTKVEEGRIRPYTSTLVLLEINYVLSRLYKIEKEKILEIFSAILQTRNLVLIEKTNFDKAWQVYQKYSIKLADCLIYSQVSEEVILVSYDQDFRKIQGFKEVQTPQEVLAQKYGFTRG